MINLAGEANLRLPSSPRSLILSTKYKPTSSACTISVPGKAGRIIRYVSNDQQERSRYSELIYLDEKRDNA